MPFKSKLRNFAYTHRCIRPFYITLKLCITSLRNIGPACKGVRKKRDSVNLTTYNSNRKLYYFPHYRGNPYQQLLYTAFNDSGINFSPGSIDRILFTSFRFKSTAFHLHWTKPILANALNKTVAIRLKDQFIRDLDKFKHKNGKFIWTIHNIIPHEANYPDLEIELRKELASRADLIHVHSEFAIHLIDEYYTLPKERVKIIPHGNYVGFYPNTISKSEARRYFGLQENDCVFLCFGYMRKYKDLPRLIIQFQKFTDENNRAKLILAGNIKHSSYRDELFKSIDGNPNIILHADFIDNDKLQFYYNAADFVVLMYKQILTSGSIILALSFSRPVIAPNLGTIPEIVIDDYNGWLYNSEEDSSLIETMKMCSKLSGSAITGMNNNALLTVDDFCWSDISGQLAQYIHKIFELGTGIN